MTEAKISVIVVVRNGEAYLAQALESILAQDLAPAEILVIDGHSQDRTGEIARRYPGVSYCLQQGLGLAQARNQGLQTAGGDWIAFLDHDDVWLPGKLRKQAAYLDAHAACELVVCRVSTFLEPGARLRPGFSRQMLEREQDGFTPGALLARRAAFAKAGLFDPALTIACDADWFARARDAGLGTYVLPEVLLRKRIHPGNLSGNVRTNRSELLRMLKRSLDRKR